MDLDRTKATMMNMPLIDVFDTLQKYTGGYYVNALNRFLRPLTLPSPPGGRREGGWPTPPFAWTRRRSSK